VHTPYRYLPCEHYCIFYVETREQVLVIRVLHEKQDCMRALFAQKE
jgi:plasmid stabilization system protein ParE